jgi:hypothetical protein
VAVSDDPADVRELEARVGHPGDKWHVLNERVQNEIITQFARIQSDWLDLVWTLDSYRKMQIVPRAMGAAQVNPGDRLAAIYRGKGNWYAELMALLLGNRTSQRLAPRARVDGFSQLHQIDVAWPDRNAKVLVAPEVCLETKLTGAPAYGSTSARGALSDWSNRRKELKFAATDLKLDRRGTETSIDHWDEWRTRQSPACYFVWGARMGARDKIAKMVTEVQALTKTYLDGAGLFAWRENAAGTGYDAVPIMGQDRSDRVSTIDDVLHRIATRIRTIVQEGGGAPEPVRPAASPVDVTELAEDTKLPDD